MPRFLKIVIFEGGGGILQLKSQSAKISENCHFRGGGEGEGRGRGDILQLKSQSAKISDNCHFRGGGGFCIAEKG